jgi:DNA-binding MarR family transcriptional regulator
MGLVGEAYRRTRQPIEQRVREHGITFAQDGILRRLADRPGLSRAEVARLNFISPQAAQVALATLEGKGLVRRRSRSDSNRVVGAVLTKKGARVLETCRHATATIGEDFFAPLSAKERETLIGLLRRCVQKSVD